ncbi:MAG: TlyA family rRNA (cytidine-2'-O)-methyltransferase, partial [Clostridia bacterium]|nr:TlyA family rRNA (cytidine-2'-O)-methyltransferase [Clostridia bacterium]
DPQVHRQVIGEIVRFVKTLDWTAQDLAYSPITGPEGNIEYLLDLRPGAEARGEVTESQIAATICAAYDNLVNSSE